MNQNLLEQQLSELPLFQYAFMKSDELTFTERVRHVCQMECPQYNTTWACPPAVGTVEECKNRCLAFENLLMISTVTEVSDIANLKETLDTRADHEAITRKVGQLIRDQGCETMTLSTESCAICPHCAYPSAPCRHPDKMYPCVESHGILVTDIAERYGMDFNQGNIVTWFSLIFYR